LQKVLQNQTQQTNSNFSESDFEKHNTRQALTASPLKTARLTEKRKRSEKIFELWLAGHTQQEIADAVGCTVQPVYNEIESFFGKVPENYSKQTHKPDFSESDFEKPIYNVWTKLPTLA
jgi:DNA-binding CsgD family transcriptional regulator